MANSYQVRPIVRRTGAVRAAQALHQARRRAPLGEGRRHFCRVTTPSRRPQPCSSAERVVRTGLYT